MSGITRIVLASALLALGIAAATSLAGPPPAGGETVTLTLATPEDPERPSSRIAKAFAEQAKALSRGKVVVRIMYDAGKTSQGLPVGKAEANLIGLARSGKAQLAIVPTRAFQAQGVTSFQALQAPFLITSDAGMAKVTAGRIAARLQSGLGTIGLTGLGLAPEGLRRPFGFKKALVAPSDFAGLRIRAISSKQTWALLRVLGAKPVDIDGDAYDAAVASGAIGGAESSLAIVADGGLPALSFTAGNIAFFPKIDAFVGNARALRDLTPEQRSILRRAAASAREWAVTRLTEQRARDSYCKQGNTVVRATAASVSQLRTKAAPVLAELRRNVLTRSLIAEIDGLGLSGSGVATCSRKQSGNDKGGTTVTSVIPKGVYRSSTLTEQQLLESGASQREARENAGFLTLETTEDGYQTVRFETLYPEYSARCDKRKMYLSKGLVVIELRGPKCGGDFAVAWKLTSDGIRFTRVSPNDAGLRLRWTSAVWRRIG